MANFVTNASELNPERANAFEFTDPDAALEHCYDRGWTDGLPVALPTEARVKAILEYAGRDPLEIIGVILPVGGIATVEKIAINAAMAGCPPACFPVVLAAIQAILKPEFNLNGVQATTHPCSPLVIVGGPMVRELGFNSRDGVFGGGSRANASVGRAVRLVLWNIGGGKPGEIDKSTFGQPGKYAYCIAEDAENNPWEPLHITRDRSLGDNAVTVFACEAPHNVADTHHDTPQGLLWVIADCMSTMGNTTTRWGGQTLVVLSPERARVLGKAGWSREDVQQCLYEQSHRKVREFQTARLMRRETPKWVNREDPEALWPIFNEPEDILVMVAGGDGPHSAVCPGWGHHGGFAVTQQVVAK